MFTWCFFSEIFLDTAKQTEENWGFKPYASVGQTREGVSIFEQLKNVESSELSERNLAEIIWRPSIHVSLVCALGLVSRV